MKFKLGMAAGAMAAALVAGTATAADYPGTASFDGTVWTVKWSTDAQVCFNELTNQLSNPLSMTINGTAYPASIQVFRFGVPSSMELNAGPPNGALTGITLAGVNHITCGGNRLLLTPIGSPAPIPTMSEWAMIAMGLALAGGAALFIQRRRLAA